MGIVHSPKSKVQSLLTLCVCLGWLFLCPCLTTPAWAITGFPSGNGVQIQDEGVSLAVRPTINYKGDGVVCVDNGATNAIDCTLNAGTGADIDQVGDCTTGECFMSTGTGTQQVWHGTGSGTITINAPAAAGSNTIAWPAETGTVALLTDNVATATALAANPVDCLSANTFANSIAANGDLTCTSIPNAATTATAGNTVNAIVARNSDGDFGARFITATLNGNAATSTALASNGTNCTAGNAPLGVDTAGSVEGCFDVATQAELDTHTALTSTAHGATSANTASKIVTRDASGNFSAGTITASIKLTGSVPTCGTNCASLSANSNDRNGDITVSAGVISAVTINFSTTLSSVPICVASTNSATVGGAAVTAVSTSAATFSTTATIGSGHIFYHCFENV